MLVLAVKHMQAKPALSEILHRLLGGDHSSKSVSLLLPPIVAPERAAQKSERGQQRDGENRDDNLECSRIIHGVRGGLTSKLTDRCLAVRVEMEPNQPGTQDAPRAGAGSGLVERLVSDPHCVRIYFEI